MTLFDALEKNMTVSTLHPTTVSGIKRLAKRLAKEGGITHSIGLDRAAEAAGFSNFKHALRQLSSTSASEASGLAMKFRTYISVLWYDPATNDRGNLTIAIDLPRRLDDMIESRQCKYLGYSSRFRRAAADRVYARLRLEYGHNPVEEVCYAARQLTFMAATGLRPCTSVDVPGRGMDEVPFKDHTSSWTDPVSGVDVMAIAPYTKIFGSAFSDWSSRNDAVIGMPNWKGIYNPGWCSMILVARGENSAAMRTYVESLNQLPLWPVTSDNIKRETTIILDDRFISPEEANAGRSRPLRASSKR